MKIEIEIDDKNVEKIVGMISTALLSELRKQPETQSEVPAEVEQADPTPVQEEAKHYTFAEVRTILTEKSREGYTDQVKALVGKYGDGKLSGVKEENYADLVNEAQSICKQHFTREDITQRIEELKSEGYSNELPGLLEYHYATSADDLKEEYFASFMRDAWRLDHAGF